MWPAGSAEEGFGFRGTTGNTTREGAVPQTRAGTSLGPTRLCTKAGCLYQVCLCLERKREETEGYLHVTAVLIVSLLFFCHRWQIALFSCFPLKGYCYRCNVELSVGEDICGFCRWCYVCFTVYLYVCASLERCSCRWCLTQSHLYAIKLKTCFAQHWNTSAKTWAGNKVAHTKFLFYLWLFKHLPCYIK